VNVIDTYVNAWRVALAHADTLDSWAAMVGLTVIPLAFIAAAVAVAVAGAAEARR
jgi:hypothetical protein